VIELLKRTFDYKRISTKAWYAPIVLLMPGVMILTYGLMRLMGLPLPIPQFPVLTVVLLLHMPRASFFASLAVKTDGADIGGLRGALRV